MVNSKKVMKKNPPERIFMCALFNDGFMIVDETWIKKPLSESEFDVHYPPSTITSPLISCF